MIPRMERGGMDGEGALKDLHIGQCALCPHSAP